MNKVILMGRLTRDPEIRYSQGDNPTAVARYTLAVDRRFRRNGDGDQSADFIGCVAFGRSAEFAEKYFRQGLKIIVTGRNAGSFHAAAPSPAPAPVSDAGDGFMNIPDGIDEELPFN